MPCLGYRQSNIINSRCKQLDTHNFVTLTGSQHTLVGPNNSTPILSGGTEPQGYFCFNLWWYSSPCDEAARRYEREFEEAMLSIQARPHWGKANCLIENCPDKVLASLWPVEWHLHCRVVKALDPFGTFHNKETGILPQMQHDATEANKPHLHRLRADQQPPEVAGSRDVPMHVHYVDLESRPWEQSWDLIVVGAGMSGATIAERHAAAGTERILVLESRSHIGGNCYDYIEEQSGVRVSKYGAHLFHTNNEAVRCHCQKAS